MANISIQGHISLTTILAVIEISPQGCRVLNPHKDWWLPARKNARDTGTN